MNLTHECIFLYYHFLFKVKNFICKENWLLRTSILLFFYTQELIKCNAKAGEDFNDLQRALDFMQAIPQRSVDLDYINRMEGYSGNIQKFGRILKEVSKEKDPEKWIPIT